MKDLRVTDASEWLYDEYVFAIVTRHYIPDSWSITDSLRDFVSKHEGNLKGAELARAEMNTNSIWAGWVELVDKRKQNLFNRCQWTCVVVIGFSQVIVITMTLRQ